MINEFHSGLLSDCNALEAKLEIIKNLNARSKIVLEKNNLYLKLKLNPTYRFNIKEYHLHLNNLNTRNLIRNQIPIE